MKFGIQLWTVRDVLKDDFSGVLEQLSETSGFQGLEFAFFYGGLKPAELAHLIKKINMEVSGLFDYLKNFTDPENEIYSYAKSLKSKYLISSFNEKDLNADLDNCLSILSKACSVAAEKGLAICYHGHPFDYADKNGSCYMERILEVRDVKLVPDTGWITHAGKDAVKFMEQNADRIPIIHLKDTKADNAITELGNGIIDLPAVLDFAAANNVEWLNYEQDNNFRISSLDSCVKSYEYMQDLKQRKTRGVLS